MPTPYLEKLHKDHKIPMRKLEEYWERAKGIAKQRKMTNQYPYIMGIFKNMVGLAEDVSLRSHSDAAKKSVVVRKSDTEKIDKLKEEGYKQVGSLQGDPNHLLFEHAPEEQDESWWEKLSKEEQENYLKQHPNSKFQVTKHDAPEESEEQSDEEQPEEEELDEEPEETEHDDVERRNSLGGKLDEAWTKARAGIISTLQPHKKGLGYLKSFLSGGSLTDKEYHQAKRTAAVAATVMLGAFAGLLLLTTGAGPLLGAIFLQEMAGGSESSDNRLAALSDEDLAAEIVDRMYEWLSQQNEADLIERIKQLEAKS